MEIKKLISLILMLLAFSAGLFAQQASEKSAGKAASGAEGETSDEELEEGSALQWQTLEWEEEDPDFVTKYKIEIEQFNSKTQSYEPLETLETKDNSTSIVIEPQLMAGAYRYKIITYDLFYVPSIESEWNDLVIHKAYTPKINSISAAVNLSQTVYLEEYNDGIFNVTGKNLFEVPESDIEISFTKYYLVNTKDAKDTNYQFDPKTLIPEIQSHDEENKKLKIYFDPLKLEVGDYYFTAIDASGLATENSDANKVTIKYKKRMDLDVSVGYEFPVVVFGSTFQNEKYFNNFFWPISANAKVTFIPLKHRWGFLGVQAEGDYSRLGSNFDAYTITGNFITGNLNLVYQKPFYRRISETQQKHFLTFEVHAGGGVAMINDLTFAYENGVSSKPLNSINFGADAGAAIQFYFTGKIYAELQTDFRVAFMPDVILGNVVPAVSVGWQF